MDFISMLSGRWLEVGVAIYLIGMVLYGHRKGFIRLAVSATAMIITLVAVNVSLPHVTDWLKHRTPVYEAVQTKLSDAFDLEQVLGSLEDAETLEKADEWMAIDELPIPEQLKQMLADNNNEEVYRMMGVEKFTDFISQYLTETVLKAVIFIALFLAVFLALQFLVLWLDLVARLPILSGLNQVSGSVLGGAEALFFIWIFCIILTGLSGTDLGSKALAQIDASPWLSWIYDHNILSQMALRLIRGGW